MNYKMDNDFENYDFEEWEGDYLLSTDFHDIN